MATPLATLTASPSLKLLGHVGSLIKVRWACEKRLVLSAADDRTARIWKVPERGLEATGATTAVVAPTLHLWGHHARVWDIACVGQCVLFSLPTLMQA